MTTDRQAADAFTRAEEALRSLAVPNNWTFDHLSMEGTYHPNPEYRWNAVAVFTRDGSRVRRKLASSGTSVQRACDKLTARLRRGFASWDTGR